MSSSRIPGIRSFQMDSSTSGIIRNSVNLFRGDVNYTQTLFSLPGRNIGDGLDINVSIQYQSNINQQAMTWNRDQPTGILGMGWIMPLPVITLDTNNSPTAGQHTYSINITGVSNRLIREAVTPFLFNLDISLANLLINAQSISPAIRSQFISLGLPVSSTAVISGTANSWVIEDDALEQAFLLVLENGLLSVYDGGESYQLVSYNFWKILYYPRYQVWRITNAAGQLSVYGGGVISDSNTGYNSSAGNSIEWAVQWVNGSGEALWQGNSSLAAGQQQYATAWHLARIYSSFGEYISYAYNEFPRNNNGLLPDVEQLVANFGKPYTKACYVTSITDVFGRRVLFNYQPKLWSNDSQSSPREYADAHKSCNLPDNSPNGFQDCYQRYYLDTIQVKNTDSTTVFNLQFDYNPGSGNGVDSAVINVAGSSGDTCKRLLTGFTLFNSNEQPLPGFGFQYYVDSTDINPGALKSITWPSGGSASYTYQAVRLPACTRDFTINAPSTNSSPRVWFGPGYAVVLWYNSGSEQLFMQIISWDGQWKSWQINPSSSLLLSGNGGTGLSTLQVITGENFVGVYFNTGMGEALYTDLYVFQKDQAYPCQWVSAPLSAGASVGCNSPSFRWNLAHGSLSIMAGDNFLLAAQTNTNAQTTSYQIFTWQWSTQTWQTDSYTSSGYLWFATGSEYYVTLDTSSNINLYHLSATRTWQSAITVNLGFTIYSYAAIQIATGSSMIAISNLTAGGKPDSAFQDYTVYLLQWSSAYHFFTPVTSFQFHDLLNNQPTVCLPVIVNNSMVAIAGHLLRFDGQSWWQNNNLLPVNAPVMGYQQRYCYGPDYAVLIEAKDVGGIPTATVVAYDASVCYGISSSWSDSTTDITVIGTLKTPTYNCSTANWANGGNDDYLIIGKQLFFRNTATNWATAVTENVTDIEALINQSGSYQLNSESMINDGPRFLVFSAFNSEQQANASAVIALTLQNGGVYGALQVLDGAKMWTPQEVSASGSNGVAPGGISCFYTYEDSANNLDSAATITLYYYAGSAIEGAISDWPVSIISINDGLSESSVTSFEPDFSTASCDPTGTVIKYYQNTVYSAGSPSNPVYGSVVNNYLNGRLYSGVNYCDMMDGLLSAVSYFDTGGRELTTQTNSWVSWNQRGCYQPDGAMAARYIYGAYVLQETQTTSRDGVSSSLDYGYYHQTGLPCPFNGRPVTVASSDLNGAGVSETIIESYTYASEVYRSSIIHNDLVTKIAQNLGINGVTIKASAFTLTGWYSVWGDDVVILAREADFSWTGGNSVFPFSDYHAGQTPTNWQCGTRILNYAANGSIIANTDSSATLQSYYYATSPGLPIAVFSGASVGECACNTFQDYEDQGSWTAIATTICTTNALFGVQSLCLPVGASLSTTVAPANGRSQYLIGFRYLTASGYQGNNSGWYVNAGNPPKTVARFLFEDTQGQWQYETAAITLPINTAAITIIANNTGKNEVLLDSIFFVPFGTGIKLLSWMVAGRLKRASSIASGAIGFNLYDNYRHKLGTVAANGQLQHLTVNFMSLQSVSNGMFNNASPNCRLTLNMRDGGFAETFIDGGQWQSRWITGNSVLWTSGFNALGKASSTPDSVTWNYTGTEKLQSIAFFIELTLPAVASPVSIRFANDQTITWTPVSGWSWTDCNNVVLQTALQEPPRMATQWLLVLSSDKLLFFAGGQLLFSQSVAVSTLANFSFNTGANVLTINHLITGFNPQLTAVYSDGVMRQRQFHHFSNADSLVHEMIYDALDNRIAQTRKATGSFGQGATLPTLQYRDSFVNVPAFLDSLDNSWQMTGDIADYYAGQAQGIYTRSNDQGYPYFGQRFEASAQQRLLECGKPGKELAIHDVNTIPFNCRQTARMTFSGNAANTPVPSVAANSYTVHTTYTASGMKGQLFIDTNNRAVATQLIKPENNSVLSQTQTSPDYHATTGNAGSIATMKLPNAFTNAPQSNSEAYVRVFSQNPQGQPSAVSDPDSGITQFLCNGANQVRFTRVPLEAGENHFLYIRYDDQGRMVEEGIVNSNWDEDTLLAQVNNSNYPSSADGSVPSRIYRYDGDGTNPNNLGKLTRVTTCSPAPKSNPSLGDCTVVEQWTYNKRGKAISASIAVSGAVTQTATVNYHYNNLNQLTQIDFPDDPSLNSIVYSYNDIGQLIAIGTPEDRRAIISYSWSADGQLVASQRGLLADAWCYNSDSTIKEHSASINAQTVFSQSYTYNLDGQIINRDTEKAFTDASENSSVSYRYDDQQRLGSATIANNGTGNLSINQYDSNGNIWNWQQDQDNCSAQCCSGNNQLETASINNRISSFHYRKDGRPDQWRGMQIEYDHALRTTAAVTNGNITVRYARGANNYRVLTQSGNDKQISFHGAGHVPLVIFTNGQPQLCIWGANALEAVCSNGDVQYPLSDHQGSVWAVVDSSANLVASYEYGAFGTILSQSGSGASAWLFHYTGRQWDGRIGLYDFNARLYDPLLMRFLAPDAAMQYASGYLFASNNPVNLIDPDGNLAKWASWLLSAALIVTGIALSIATDGLAAPIAEGIEEGGDVVLAGENVVTTGQKLGYVAQTTLRAGFSGAFIGAGNSGLIYDISSGNSFSWKAYGETVGIGAASGFVSSTFGGVSQNGGLLTGLNNVIMQSSNGILKNIVFNTIGDVIGDLGSTLLTDACNHTKPTWAQIGWSALLGFGCGVMSGAIGSAFSNDDNTAWKAAKGLYVTFMVSGQNAYGDVTDYYFPGMKATGSSATAISPAHSASNLSAGLYTLTSYQDWGKKGSPG